MRYYIADPHFYHAAMNDHMDHRGFGSVEEMNEYMIARWNGKVRRNDEVVVIGDLSWGNIEDTNAVLRRLNGTLYLILGNHDHILSNQKIDTRHIKWMKHYEELSDNKRKVILCHYPILFYNGQYHLDKEGSPKTYMLHGHIHDSMDQRLVEQFQEMTRNTVTVNMQGREQKIPCNLINCFCKYSDYEPLTLDEWIELDQRRRSV